MIDPLKGRRLPVIDGEMNCPTEPGDYCGPVIVDGVSCVFFLKPNSRDSDAPKMARPVHFVASPPHVFTEEPDGTLTIRASIGDRRKGDESDGWHGYLTKGLWHLAKGGQ